MSEVPRESLAVGDWFAPCCVHDLQQITSEAELVEAQTFALYAGGWRTRDEALTDLLSPARYAHQQDREDDVAWAREHFFP